MINNIWYDIIFYITDDVTVDIVITNSVTTADREIIIDVLI